MDPTNEMYRDRYVPEATPRQGFWRRQFSGDTTGDQLAFDVIFGVILPIGCLIFDPIVFRSGSGFGGGGLLAEYRILAYAFIGFQILMLGLCLLAGRRLRGAGAVMSGALFSGSLAALAIGVALFPLSFFGLMFLIGILGFTPFLTSFVFLRNGIRSIRLTPGWVGPKVATILIVGGALAAPALPLAANVAAHRMVDRSLAELAGGDVAAHEGAVTRLRWLAPLADLDQLVWKYETEKEPDRKSRLADAFRRITGDEIESRLTVLRD